MIHLSVENAPSHQDATVNSARNTDLGVCQITTFYAFKKISDQIRSVAQSCPTLCDPMNRSTPGLPVHHQLPEFTQTHQVSDATSHVILCRLLLLLPPIPSSIRVFSNESTLHISGQSIGVSALASVLPMNTQD